MATVTVFTAERTAEIEATSIVSGVINDEGHLVLTRHDGTPIDMGAVSGMQMNPGTGYTKVDAFSYIGPTDPGAVPNGSVWYDTNDVAGPNASVTQKGLVELATNAETQAGTDTQRAVTPAALASLPGSRVQMIAPVTETALWTAYPVGVSLMSLTTGSGWSPNNGFGTVITSALNSGRTTQTFFASAGGGNPALMWVRSYNAGDNTGGWTAWSQVTTTITLNSGSFSQTTALNSYPKGHSRLYFTTANSTGWDFAGMAGEVLTYTEGTDFAKQTFIQHLGSSSGKPAQWYRTATATGGWTAWQKPLNDQGAWTSWTPSWITQTSLRTPSLGNATVSCKYLKTGRKVDCEFEITFGSTTNFGSGATAGDNWLFSLPLPAASMNDTFGFVQLTSTNSATCIGRVRAYSDDYFLIGLASGRVDGVVPTNVGDIDSLTPWTWTSGNYIKGNFTYETLS